MANRDKRKKPEYLGRWKVVCDRTGYEIWSTDARIDHRGRLVHKDYYEPQHYSELEQRLPVDRAAPYPTRVEPADVFKAPTPVSVDHQVYWNTNETLWNLETRTWDEDKTT